MTTNTIRDGTPLQHVPIQQHTANVFTNDDRITLSVQDISFFGGPVMVLVSADMPLNGHAAKLAFITD